MEKIAIWGAGRIGRKCYLALKDRYEIVAFYDSDSTKWGKFIDGVPIVQFDFPLEYIVIAIDAWREVVDFLQEKHLEIMTHYIPWWMVQGDIVSYVELKNTCSEEQMRQYFKLLKRDKKIAVVYGNCQTRMISKMLNCNEEFQRQYIVLDFPLIYEFNNYPKGLDKEIANNNDLWSNVDLFIYQKISTNNRFSREMSTEYLLSLVSESCKKICIVNIYFDGYFPQCKRLESPLPHKVLNGEYFLYEDFFLSREIEQYGVENIEEVIQVISNEDYLERQEIIENCTKSIEELKKRELEVDVKISDYIEKYYMEEQLFFSFDHPNNRVLLEYVNRILNRLGLRENKDFSETDSYILFGSLKSADMLIYPCILKALNIKRYERYYYANRGINREELLDFEAYQRKYIEYRWNNK